MSETDGVVVTEPSIGKLAAALAAAQAEIKNPQRNREVTVQTKMGGKYKFKYATLDAIIDCIRGPLTKNGLWFTQTMESIDGRLCLVTTLLHSSGERTHSTVPLGNSTSNQELGSELTYKRRYSLTALLGVAADEDDDGNIADGNTSTPTPTRAPDKVVGKVEAKPLPEGDPLAAEIVMNTIKTLAADRGVDYDTFKATAGEFVKLEFGVKTKAQFAALDMTRAQQIVAGLHAEFGTAGHEGREP